MIYVTTLLERNKSYRNTFNKKQKIVYKWFLTKHASTCFNMSIDGIEINTFVKQITPSIPNLLINVY